MPPASSQSSMRNGRSSLPPDIRQYENETRTRQGTKRVAKRLSSMAHDLKYEAQQHETSAGGLLAGLFLLMVFALGVVALLAFLALT